MLNLFRRRDERGGSSPSGPAGPALASHILAKFLKRLRAMSHPHLLDLGRLSGANIEFFARVGCRVQVEDLLSAPDDSEPGTPSSEAEREDEAPAAPILTDAGLLRSSGTAQENLAVARPARSSGVPVAAASTAAISMVGSPLRRTGARPSRRIVLPPRTFGSGGARPGATPGAIPAGGLADPMPARPGRARLEGARCDLPSTFPYPDESFDAVVAWDIYNYYDPESARLVAAETRRILKPGGLLLSYFHARRLDRPESPGRYRIQTEQQVVCDPLSGRLLRRHVFQNRDIEKMFTGLRIVELYFLKNSMREILMEKKSVSAPAPERPKAPPAPPRPRFTIE